MTRLASLAALAVMLAPPLAAQDLGPRVSGDARMGIVYAPAPDWARRESGLRMTSRTRLKFEFTGETDGGTRFGAELRLDQTPDRRPSPSFTLGD